MFVNCNGNYYSLNEPALSAANRSFLYGDGLFESMRMINEKIMFLEEHIHRLKQGMNALHIQTPSYFNISFLTDKIIELAAKNGINKHARIRLNVFRKEGGFYAPEDDNAGWLISINQASEIRYEINSMGLHIDIFPELKKSVNKLSSFKTCNALIYVLAGVWKNARNLDEVLILNENNRICEGLNANVFMLTNNQVITTPVSEGCIEGVMRNQVINIIKERNILFSEAKIEISDMNSADEIFLTNASSGLRWVSAYKNNRYFSKFSKEMVNSLNKLI